MIKPFKTSRAYEYDIEAQTDRKNKQVKWIFDDFLKHIAPKFPRLNLAANTKGSVNIARLYY